MTIDINFYYNWTLSKSCCQWAPGDVVTSCSWPILLCTCHLHICGMQQYPLIESKWIILCNYCVTPLIINLIHDKICSFIINFAIYNYSKKFTVVSTVLQSMHFTATKWIELWFYTFISSFLGAFTWINARIDAAIPAFSLASHSPVKWGLCRYIKTHKYINKY